MPVTRRIRIPSRLSPLLAHNDFEEVESERSSVRVGLQNGCLDDSDEDQDDEDDYAEEEEFQRMRELIRKKFSITGEDDISCSSTDCTSNEEDIDIYDPIEV